ncbi:MAG: metal ABC transporter permease [Planctomycetota bacterium]
MTPGIIQFDIRLDLFPLTAALLASIVCALLGNFLVLRKLSLMGDAISHSVLPGLVVALILASSRSAGWMFLGAAAAGVLTVVLVELVKSVGRVEPGAAMGVVFSIMFAVGILLIEQASLRQVDIDADCLLHGQLEALAWFGAPSDLAGLFTPETLKSIPRQVVALLAATCLAAAMIGLLFKELRLAAFDPSLATSLGFNATALHYILMTFVAAATVASFEAVGSILVIAMLICPAATARLLTDSLVPQIICSVVIASITAAVGYFAATSIPAAFGLDSVNAAGSITVVSGIALMLAIVAGPRHGLIARAVRRRNLARITALEDLLAALYRAEERGHAATPVSDLSTPMAGRPFRPALRLAEHRSMIDRSKDAIALTDR